MTTKIDVPDSIRPFLNEIAERIWNGRAAVMVGAGFSKNAGPGFPDLNQLGDRFYEKSHGVKPNAEQQKFLNVLRLAEEVQASIGRPALENLIRAEVPDIGIQPSSLHIDLLKLPWVDVFTTNYDTLLERASAMVVSRHYEPVLNSEDLPYARKPRIVKLHGSFPSERPFIITEEDYRTYPSDHAPFVNTVQQALLENTFCLIGFSGDDPNFLQWIGWIRENLGRDKIQKIYLVGVFDLSVARLQLMADRGIIVVDLSCCIGIEKNDHQKGLNKFFDYVNEKKPDAQRWPRYSQSDPSYPVQGFSEFEDITEVWRLARESYPGWLILPHQNREDLWLYTRGWTSQLPCTVKSPPGLDIRFAYELVWRLERCLMPLFESVAVFCEKLLEKYWPFQSKPLGGPEISIGVDSFPELPWNILREAWIGIALPILRGYRLSGNLEKWEMLEKKLRSLSGQLSGEALEFLNYEGFLLSLFTLDVNKAQRLVKRWRPNESEPYWMAKRAAALAETGSLSEAESAVKDALERIRRKLNEKMGAEDFNLDSRESYAMLLAKYIQGAAEIERDGWVYQGDKKNEFQDRWDELRKFNCDPWNEIKLLELTLRYPSAEPKEFDEARGFDIGYVTTTRRFGFTSQREFASYSFLRFFEEVGLPFRIGNSVLGKKIALANLENIAEFSPFWATATMVRLGDEKAVDNVFSREYVSRFSIEEADRLIETYLDVLHSVQKMPRPFSNAHSVRLLKLLPEVLSRLCTKSSDLMKERVLLNFLQIYGSDEKEFYGNLTHLTSRVLASMSEIQTYVMIPELLETPFPQGLTEYNEHDFVNPLASIDFKERPQGAPEMAIDSEVMDRLLKQSRSEHPTERRWAIRSIVTLHHLELLDEGQIQSAATAIWARVDDLGFPSDTEYFKFDFLTFPHPQNVEPERLFRQYLAATSFPLEKDDGSIAITGGRVPLSHEIIRASRNKSWTSSDTEMVIRKLIDWWNDGKKYLAEREALAKEFRDRYARLVDLVAELGPHLDRDSPEELKNAISGLISELKVNNVESLRAEVACLHLNFELKDSVCARTKACLLSNERDSIIDALAAIKNILLKQNEENTSADMISIFTEYLTWGPTKLIHRALWVVIRVLQYVPDRFAGELENSTLERLDRLFEETDMANHNLEIRFEEKLEIRETSSILAAELFYYYQSQGVVLPAVIGKWAELAHESNEFAEIRKPWLTYRIRHWQEQGVVKNETES